MYRTDLIIAAEEFIRLEFELNLSRENVYHNFEHTRDVVLTANEIAIGMGISSEVREELIIASWFHDIGYMQNCIGHEELSAEKVEIFLMSYHFPKEKIKNVSDCILATKIPQCPTNKIGEILCDADLHHLGTNEFLVKSELLRTEITHKDCCVFTDAEWIQKNINFMSSHHFFTDYAIKNFGAQKEENLKFLGKILNDTPL